MANCPNCAEAFGWSHLLRPPAVCACCKLPLQIVGNGRVETYASRHADEILSQAQDQRYWTLLGIGLAATFFIAVVPMFGLLTFFVLPIVQGICLERSVQRYREHFGLLHGLTVDFFSSLFFLVLVATQSIANLVAGPGAALVAVPLYLFAWWGYGKYCELHFRRVAACRQPSILELSIIGMFFGAIVMIPTLLLAAVLFSYFLG